MRRYSNSEAFILSQTPWGENHERWCLLTPDYAQVTVTCHGARGSKAKSRGVISSLSLISASISQVSGEQWSLGDHELIEPFLGLRSSLQAVYHAAFAAELMEKSPLTEGERWPFEGILAHFSVMSRDPRLCRRATIQFIWRWLGRSGLRPEADLDVRSGKALDVAYPLWWDTKLAGFTNVATSPLPPDLESGALAYLRSGERQRFEDSVATAIRPEVEASLLQFLRLYAVEQLGGRMRSLESGAAFW